MPRASPGCPGRGYIRLGHASLVPFQAAGSAGAEPARRRPPAVGKAGGMLRDLPGVSRPSGPGHAPVPFGFIDVPDLQRQRPAALSLDTSAT